jgi:hypothetical protein
VSEWQPIETAPKDGTWILVFENHEKPLDTVMWNHFYGLWRNGYNDHASYPTHWQPLPEPPVQP